jgi:hypothetical protein
MLPISRRQLLGLLAGFLAPSSRAGSPPHQDYKPSALSTICPDADSIAPAALDAWQRLPMLPLIDFKSFSAAAETDGQQFLGRMILGHIKSQTDFEFRYFGGSDPGITRRVLPILWFRKFEMASDVPDLPNIYLLAFWHTRQQARTFRLDRLTSR